MTQKQELRHLFIHEFVKELIKNTKSSPLPDIPEEQVQEIEEVPEIPITKIKPSPFRIKPIPIQKPQYIIPPIKPIMRKEIKSGIKGMQASPKTKMTMQSFQTPKAGIPIARPIPGNVDLGKLNFLIVDPRIQSIECPGPTKNVLVKKDGSVQRTSVVLTKEEIQNIINNFSEQTRIPLLGGVFKAAFGNLIMTAVISDFVGSRFVVQKKTPFQQY